MSIYLTVEGITTGNEEFHEGTQIEHKTIYPDMGEGVEIDLKHLPVGIKKIRFFYQH